MNLALAFITGLTTGGLSCMAVQGGLLASSLAHQIEQDLRASPIAAAGQPKPRAHIAQPVSLFLLAKLIAYTILGLLLGVIGSVLVLSPLVRAILMIAIGIFMVGNALRMLKVHPIFRYFVFEPPAFITRYIRRKAKKSVSLVTPLFLGAMTILIPCGITQAMMAAALGSGNPLQGGMIMFSFTLGTIPVFFTIAYFTTRLGAVLEKYFTYFVALTLVVLGLISVNYGLTLAGSPVSFNRLVSWITQPSRTDSVNQGEAPAATLPADGYVIVVKNGGYEPQTLHLIAGKPVTLKWITVNTTSCASSVVVPALKYEQVLPVTGAVAFEIPAQPKGTVINYSCSMGMYTGQLVFDLDLASP